MPLNKTKLNNDLMFGLSSEEWIKDKLEKKYGSLVKLDPFNNFDFYGGVNNIFIEVKTRKMNHDKYPTLMFSKKKLDKGYEHYLDNGCNITFIWRCYDGVYTWDYITGETVASNYEIKMSGRKDRGTHEIEECVHIKTGDLYELEIGDQ